MDGNRKHADLILKRGTVITMDPERRILENASVAVEGTRIAAVGPADDIEAAYSADREIDCLHKAILPGLIDAHGHAGHALLKTIGADTRSHWMHIATPTYHHYTTDEFWYVEARLAALERLKMGVTCGVSVISSARPSAATTRCSGATTHGAMPTWGSGGSWPSGPVIRLFRASSAAGRTESATRWRCPSRA